MAKIAGQTVVFSVQESVFKFPRNSFPIGGLYRFAALHLICNKGMDLPF